MSRARPTDRPADLAKAIALTGDPTIDEMLLVLQKAAARAHGTLILYDGAN